MLKKRAFSLLAVCQVMPLLTFVPAHWSSSCPQLKIAEGWPFLGIPLPFALRNVVCKIDAGMLVDTEENSWGETISQLLTELYQRKKKKTTTPKPKSKCDWEGGKCWKAEKHSEMWGREEEEQIKWSVQKSGSLSIALINPVNPK